MRSSATTPSNSSTAVPTRYVAEFEFQGSELVYSDPPYLKRTRTSRRRYRFDYEEADHVALLELLKGVPCQVMVSGYPSTLYEERLRGWRSVEWQVMNQDGVRTEKLWFNFAPERLHWARYAGKNFTDRQRIKRKAQSWGPALRGAAAGRAPRGARGDDGGRGRAVGHGHGEQGVAAHRVRRAQGALRVVVRRGQDVPREPRPRRRPADAVRAADGGVHGKAHPEEPRQLRPAPLSEPERRHRAHPSPAPRARDPRTTRRAAPTPAPANTSRCSASMRARAAAKTSPTPPAPVTSAAPSSTSCSRRSCVTPTPKSSTARAATPRPGRASPPRCPAPLQYGPGIKAYVVHLLIAQMLSLKRVAQSMHALIGQLLSEATLLGYIAQLHHALAEWERQAIERLLAQPAMHVDETLVARGPKESLDSRLLRRDAHREMSPSQTRVRGH